MDNIITIMGPKLTDIAGYDNKGVNNEIIKTILSTLEKHPKSTLLTSASTGIEMFAAEAALAIKMPIQLVIPCASYESKWPSNIQKTYKNIRSNAECKILSSEPWSGKLMTAKDKYLHETSNIVYHFYSVLPRFMDPNKSLGLLRELKHEYFIQL